MNSIAGVLRDELARQKTLKLLARHAPVTHKMFFGRKYILPAYRQADYAPQDFENFVAFDRLCTYAAGAAPTHDEPWMICLGAAVASLSYNRPTLFLERELGQALMRTDVLENLETGDIKWKWPAFRVYLPAGLVTIERAGESERRWAVYFDVTEVHSAPGYSCPLPLARELDRFVFNNIEVRDGYSRGPRMRLEQTNFSYKEHGMSIGTALNKSDDPGIVQTVYAQVKPWGEITLTKYINIAEDLKGGHRQDEADKRFLKKLEHLVVNVMLFLSMQPEGLEPGKVLRAAALNPKKAQSELVEAVFIGQAQSRAQRTGEYVKHVVRTTSGRHLAAHWVSGHWRRVVHGPGGAGRRLAWIRPYQTAEAPSSQK